jgi:hypothetical protein
LGWTRWTRGVRVRVSFVRVSVFLVIGCALGNPDTATGVWSMGLGQGLGLGLRFRVRVRVRVRVTVTVRVTVRVRVRVGVLLGVLGLRF